MFNAELIELKANWSMVIDEKLVLKAPFKTVETASRNRYCIEISEPIETLLEAYMITEESTPIIDMFDIKIEHFNGHTYASMTLTVGERMLAVLLLGAAFAEAEMRCKESINGFMEQFTDSVEVFDKSKN